MDIVKGKPNSNVIDLLNLLLEEAKNGELQSLACAGVYFDASTRSTVAGGYYSMALLGALRVVEREVIDLYAQISRKPLEIYCE
jgi:hypothetical protein